MIKLLFLTAAAGLPATAQAAAVPQTYTFTAVSEMAGPTTLTVNRNGPMELIEVSGAAGGYQLRVLYDFQAHRIYTSDPGTVRCTTQQYSSTYAPGLWDPIGSGEEGRVPPLLKTIRREPVNGIATRVVESDLSEGEGKIKIWLDEKFGFPVKQTIAAAGGPERLLFEIRKISYAPSAATLFTAPGQCTRIGGASNANGGSAEFNVDASAQGQANLGQTDQGSATAVKPVAPAGDSKRLMGTWEFDGKDCAGTQWRGTLTVKALEPNSFDPAEYSNMCDLDLNAPGKGKGVSNACLYDPRAKTLSLVGGTDERKYSITAVLSQDGASLTQGRWAEGAAANGTWSATRNSGAAKR